MISKGKLTLDAIETIKANVSSVVLRFIYDSDDDDDEVNAFDMLMVVVKTITIVVTKMV